MAILNEVTYSYTLELGVSNIEFYLDFLLESEGYQDLISCIRVSLLDSYSLLDFIANDYLSYNCKASCLHGDYSISLDSPYYNLAALECHIVNSLFLKDDVLFSLFTRYDNLINKSLRDKYIFEYLVNRRCRVLKQS